jgi:glycosyltransferase involved in cell wall biosynthesis
MPLPGNQTPPGALIQTTDFMVSVVVPVLNEAANLPTLIDEISERAKAFPRYEIIIVDDGSTDGTLEVLRRLSAADEHIHYVSLSRNFGQQHALRAGLDHAAGDCVISMDGDLQHPPELISEMVERWKEGFQIVNNIRNETSSLPLMKRVTSRAFYTLSNYLSGLNIEPGSSDFRLLDRRVVAVLSGLKEADVVYRVIIPTLGFSVTTIRYQPRLRLQEETRYTLTRMVRLALRGLIGTSMKPLRLATIFSLTTALFAIIFGGYAVAVFVSGKPVPGWTSVIIILAIMGAMQLLVLGIIGEYLGQVLRETLGRPPYVVSEAHLGDRRGEPAT